jgi:hypothetical protein
MYRIILLIHIHTHTHTSLFCLSSIIESWGIQASTQVTNVCDSFGVPFTYSQWEKDKWPLLPQERRYHHVASIHLWQVLVKHASRGNAALLSGRKTSTIRREWSYCSSICLCHIPQNFHLKELMITKPRTKSLTLWIPVNKCPSTDRILLHFSSFHITTACFSKVYHSSTCNQVSKAAFLFNLHKKLFSVMVA